MYDQQRTVEELHRIPGQIVVQQVAGPIHVGADAEEPNVMTVEKRHLKAVWRSRPCKTFKLNAALH